MFFIHLSRESEKTTEHLIKKCENEMEGIDSLILSNGSSEISNYSKFLRDKFTRLL